MKDPRSLLNQILTKVADAHTAQKRPKAIFDLDSTLFCVSPRTQVILRELSSDPDLMEKDPAAAQSLAKLEVTPKDWGIRTVLNRHGVKSTLEFFEALRNKWSERFFSSDYLHHDSPYPGAVEFVNKVKELGAEIYYLTGRDKPRMEEGTLRSLAKSGMPLATPEHLKMKPDSKRHDAEFKKEVLKNLKVELHPSWFFENEPVIINLVRPHIPALNIIYIDSVHSGREVAPSDLPTLPTNYLV